MPRVRAYTLSARRDVGAGLRRPRGRAPDRLRGALRPSGFALRLQRGMLVGFGCGVFLLGAMYGSILGDVEDMLEGVDGVEEALAEAGGASFAESFASTVMVVFAVVAAVYVVIAAAAAPRRGDRGPRRTAAGHRAVAGPAGSGATWPWRSGGTVTLLLAGLGFGLAGAASTGDRGLVLALTGAALAYAPALGSPSVWRRCSSAGFPRAPRRPGSCPSTRSSAGYLGQILQFPDWMNDVSPFGHIPRLPAEDMDWTPMLLLTFVAAALLAAGLAGFRRRDLETK